MKPCRKTIAAGDSNDAVETAIDLAKSGKAERWEGWLKRHPRRIGQWSESTALPPKQDRPAPEAPVPTHTNKNQG